MKDTEYTYAVAYIKTLENKMLTQNEIEGLLLSENLQTAIKILKDKGYGNPESTSSDEMLKAELEKAWTEAKNVCPEGAPLDILLYKNDFHNLKTILKALISGVDYESLLLQPCLVSPSDIVQAIQNVSFDDLAEFIREPARNAYKLITETNDGQLTEIYLDKEYLIAMRDHTQKNEFLIGWVDLNISIANMKTVVRAVGKSKDFISNALIETENSQRLCEASLTGKQAVIDAISASGYPQAAEQLSDSFSAFEKWCDNKKTEYIKRAKLKSFGFEPILAFLIGKEYELQTVRIILGGKQNNIPVEIVRERLRDLYV